MSEQAKHTKVADRPQQLHAVIPFRNSQMMRQDSHRKVNHSIHFDGFEFHIRSLHTHDMRSNTTEWEPCRTCEA